MKRAIILSILTLASCAACPPQIVQSHKTDSVRIVERLRDTIITLPPDSTLLRAMLHCDSLGQVQMERIEELESRNNKVQHNLSLEGNILTSKAITPPSELQFKLHERDTERLQTTKQTQVVEVNRLSWWQRLWIGCGQIAAAALVIALLLRRWR